MEFKIGEQGNTNGRGKPRGKSLSKYLMEMLSDNDKATGRPIKAMLAEKAIKIALDDNTLGKEFLALLEEFMDRESGKAVAININSDVTENPFADIDTAKLEALKAKLLEGDK